MSSSSSSSSSAAASSSSSSSSSSLPQTPTSGSIAGPGTVSLTDKIAALEREIAQLADEITAEKQNGNIDMVKLLLAKQTALQAQQTALQVEKNLLTQQQLQSSSSASVAASGPLLFILHQFASIQCNACAHSITLTIRD